MLISGYISLFAFVIAATIILYLPISFVIRRRGVGLLRQSSFLLLFLSFFLVIFCTIILFGLPISLSPKGHILNLQPLQWLWKEGIINRVATEIIPNILVFVPLGIFIPIVFKRMRKLYTTGLAVFCVTLGIEFFQYFIGRSSDIDDLLANLSGGLIGYGLFKIAGRLFKNKAWWKSFAGL